MAIGTAGYAMTSGPSERIATAPPTTHATATTHPQPRTKPSVKKTPKPTPTPQAKPVDRGSFNVAIYNNSNIKGLAARTSAKTQTFGWKVVTTSQWYGTVDTSTVFYPPKMKAAAQQLATDLGISSIKPAVSPMQMDQLTVILTATYGG
ncbi:MAG: LytR C-terminal domain-containing protein [Marmoricola sp.]